MKFEGRRRFEHTGTERMKETSSPKEKQSQKVLLVLWEEVS